QCLEHGIGDVGAGAVLCLLGGCTQVRGDNNLGQLEQRGVGAGLGVVDIETGTTDVAGLDRIRQCLLIDEATAGRVDDDLALLGLGQELGVEHAGGLLGLGQVDGNEVGATHQFFQLHELYAELCGTCRVGVGIVGDDGGLESSEALSEQLSDVAEADDADGLAEDLHTVEGGALQLAVTQGGDSGRARARGETACSHAEWMLEVGALATMTPASVAAGMSTLSRPTPARPTIFRLGAAAMTSASTLVAERTRRASASLTASSSSGRLGPSTQRTSTASPSASTVDCASLSAISTTGRPFWLTRYSWKN